MSDPIEEIRKASVAIQEASNVLGAHVGSAWHEREALRRGATPPANSIEAMAVIEAARRMHTSVIHDFDHDPGAYSQHVAHFSAALKAYDEKYPPALARLEGET